MAKVYGILIGNFQKETCQNIGLDDGVTQLHLDFEDGTSNRTATQCIAMNCKPLKELDVGRLNLLQKLCKNRPGIFSFIQQYVYLPLGQRRPNELTFGKSLRNGGPPPKAIHSLVFIFFDSFT